MGSYLDNLVALLENGKQEMHAPGLSEGDMQDIVSESQEYGQKCSREVEQAKLTVEKTAEQLSSIKEARIASETKAATAAAEENDARLAAEITQKMLEEAAMVHSIANKETARILEKAGVALQETIRTANSYYQKKIKQREEIDIATVRLFATEKAIDYAVARAKTAVSGRVREKLLAEKLTEVKTAEIQVVGWMQRMDEVLAEKEAARFDKVMAQLEASLQDAEQRTANSLLAEEEEKKSSAIYVVEQKAAGEAEIEALEQRKRQKLAEKQAKTEELLFSQADSKTTLEASNIAATAATMLAAEAETAINQGKVDQETAIKKLEEHLQAVREDVGQKKEAYLLSGEALTQIKDRISNIDQLIAQLNQQAAQAVSEEQAARDAADTARKLADNAVKVRLSISSESANLLMQAQQVLVESANNAEEAVVRQQQLRAEIEQQYQQALADEAQGESAVHQAEQVMAQAKADWDKEEERLVREIEAADKAKTDWSQAFDTKIKEYENRLMAARDQAEQLKQAAATAQQKVGQIEKAIEALDAAIYAFEPAKEALICKTDQICESYLAASQDKLNQISVVRQAANEEAVLYRQTLGEAKEAIASMENKEAELRAKLEVARAHVARIIEVAKDQLLTADAEVNLWRAEEEACNKALGEVAEYLESINIEIPALATDTQSLLETAVREAPLFGAPQAAAMAEPEAEIAAIEATLAMEATESAEQTAIAAEPAAEAMPAQPEAAWGAALVEAEEPPEQPEPPEKAEAAALPEENEATAWPEEQTEEAAQPAEVTPVALAVADDDDYGVPIAVAALRDEVVMPAPKMESQATAQPEPIAAAAAEAAAEPEMAAVEIATAMLTEDILLEEPQATGFTAAAGLPASETLGEVKPEHDLYEEAVQAQLTIELEATRLLEELAALAAAEGVEEDYGAKLAEALQKHDAAMAEDFAVAQPPLGQRPRATIVVSSGPDEAPAAPEPAPLEAELTVAAAGEEIATDVSEASQGPEEFATAQPAALAIEAAELAAAAEAGLAAPLSSDIVVEPERALTPEEEEEAAIMAGLSGSIPRISKDDAAEFSAWLDLIDGDIINKMMQDEQPSHKVAAPQVNLDDWMANLEKTLDEEELAAKKIMAQKMESAEKKAVAASEEEDYLPEEEAAREISAAPVKKAKKSFRFF
jgi:hypothetical protein